MSKRVVVLISTLLLIGFVSLVYFFLKDAKDTDLSVDYSLFIPNPTGIQKIDWNSSDSMKWVDSDYLLYPGKEGVKRGVYGVRLSTNEINLVKDTTKSLNGLFCYDSDFLYTVNSKIDMKSGQENIFQQEMYLPSDYVYGKNCTPKKIPEQIKMRGNVLPLLAGEGFILLERGGKDLSIPSKMFFVSEKGESETALPLEFVEERDVSLNWVPFLHKYVLRNGSDLWWLSLDGKKAKVESVQWKSTDWLFNTPEKVWVRTIPVRDGFIDVIRYNGGESDEYKVSGAYFRKEGGSNKKVVQGLIESYAVSPDGCKISFGLQKEWDLNRWAGVYTLSNPDLMIFDLCRDMKETS